MAAMLIAPLSRASLFHAQSSADPACAPATQRCGHRRMNFKADLPGVADEDLEISLAGNRLTVSGRREAEARNDNDRFYAYERVYGNFSRTFTLPEQIDTERVTAALDAGVLTIEVPKKPEAQPKKIAVGQQPSQPQRPQGQTQKSQDKPKA
jgi:hypothetical protein